MLNIILVIQMLIRTTLHEQSSFVLKCFCFSRINMVTRILFYRVSKSFPNQFSLYREICFLCFTVEGNLRFFRISHWYVRKCKICFIQDITLHNHWYAEFDRIYFEYSLLMIFKYLNKMDQYFKIYYINFD